MSSTSASAHREPCSASSVADAATSRPVPIAVLTASPITELRSAGSSRLAAMKSTICPTRTAP